MILTPYIKGAVVREQDAVKAAMAFMNFKFLNLILFPDLVTFTVY
jgi:hypothetical protein